MSSRAKGPPPDPTRPPLPGAPGVAVTHELGDLYRLLVDRVQDYAIFALDPSGHILTWNAGAQRLKQYTPEEAIGRHFSMFYPEEALAAGRPEEEIAEAIATGRAEDEGWRLRKDGTRFWANVLITALRDAQGTLIGFAKVTRDLTERRAAEQLAQHTAQVEAANRAKSEFLAAMSHELRTPLNAIGGYAQLMQLGVSGPVSEEQHVNLARIQRSQQHLLGIINDILNFSRIEAGQVAYDIGPVPLVAVVEAVMPIVAVQAGEKRLAITFGGCPSAPVARADKAKVEQILVNLLSNAVKFTPVDGTITITCGDDAEVVWVAVQDTGIGIPEDQLEPIFAPFVQVGRDLANPKDGTGLGLAISRDLALAMQGDLRVQSTLGAGSTFTLTLPREA